jgi:hypothetical protein
MQALKDYPLGNLTMPFLMVILNEFPEELAACYNRILEKIPRKPPNLRTSFFKALKWITLAQQPLYVEEVAEACMINVDQSSFETDRYIKPRDIINALLGLIRLKPDLQALDDNTLPRKTHVVSLAHFSVQEYPIMDEKNSMTPSLGCFEPGLAQKVIARSCLIYVYICSCSLQRNQGVGIWTLKDYAWHHWAAHAQATYSCLLGVHVQPDALRMFNEVAFPPLYANPRRLESHRSTSLLLYEDIRRCLSSKQHTPLLATLQDPTFPKDNISTLRYGSEFQASKNRSNSIDSREESSLHLRTSGYIIQVHLRSKR